MKKKDKEIIISISSSVQFFQNQAVTPFLKSIQ